MSLITVNFGLVGSNRFGAEARSRVLPENPTAIHGLNIPYNTVGIIADLEEVGFRVHCTRIAQSDSEPTLVLQVSEPENMQKSCINGLLTRLQKSYINGLLTRIANRYAQDCIAVQDNLGRGALIGTFSHVWGEFNADYFINY